MNFEDERYVRVYTRDTVKFISMTWQARAVLWEMIRKADRSGVIDVDGTGASGLAALLRIPADVVAPAVEELLANGSVVTGVGSYTLPNYVRAQECRQTDRRRQEESRAKRRENSMVVSQNVTECHQPSPAVTNGHSVPSLAVPSRAKPSRNKQTRRTSDPHPHQAEANPDPASPAAQPTPEASASLSPEVARVWSEYLAARADRTKPGHEPKLTTARRDLIKRRLKDHPVDQLVNAVRGIWLSDFNVQGGHTSIELAIRDASKVERYGGIGASGRRVGTLATPPIRNFRGGPVQPLPDDWRPDEGLPLMGGDRTPF